MPGRLEIGTSWRSRSSAQGALRVQQGELGAMRLLLLADFSGRASRSAHDAAGLRGRRPLPVDFERFAGVMQTLAPRVDLPAGSLQIESLDDFHPDRLIAQLPRLAQLQRSRHAAAAPPPHTEDDSATIGRLLGRPAAAAPAAAGGIDALLRRVVAPHVVAAGPAPQPQATAALAEQLRAVLADPGLQAVEAAWRGVEWLLSRLELDEGLELHLLDCTRQEIAADLVAAGGEPAQTGLLQALTSQHDDEASWLAIAGLFDFDHSTLDLALLAALGSVATLCKAPFICGAAATLQQAALTDRLGTGWSTLCSSEVAPWLALAAPRVLMRPPYGAGGETVQTLAFEEVSSNGDMRGLLWAPASLFCALAVGQAVNQNQPDPLNAGHFEAAGLPAALTAEPGLLCAEQRFDAAEAARLQDQGLVVLRGHRGRHSLVIADGLSSLAGPQRPLASG